MNVRITLPFVLVWVAIWNRMWVIGLFLQMLAVCATVWKQKTDLHFNICYVSASIISLLLKVKGLFKTTTKLCNILKLGFGCCIPQRVNVLHFLLWFVVWKISTSFLLQKKKKGKVMFVILSFWTTYDWRLYICSKLEKCGSYFFCALYFNCAVLTIQVSFYSKITHSIMCIWQMTG